MQHLTYHWFYILLQAYADALLVIPKILAQNSGYDPQETIVKLQVIKSKAKETKLVLKVSIYFDCNEGSHWPMYFTMHKNLFELRKLKSWVTKVVCLHAVLKNLHFAIRSEVFLFFIYSPCCRTQHVRSMV